MAEKTGRKIKHTRRGWSMDQKRRSIQKWEVYYQKQLAKKVKQINGK